ncbi:MAG: hypothetical protein IT303_08575 [Dehalococcoidia bacterium]|nr:hypothetical protein [Dehalococcoidia bacterium]
MPTIRPKSHASVRLLHPRAGGTLDASRAAFRWAPVKARRGGGLRYRLSVYALRPGQPLAKAASGRPLYAADGLKETQHRVPAVATGFKPGRGYCWNVEAVDQAGAVVSSAMRGFRLERKRTAPAPVGMARLDMGALRDPANHLPHAPFVWGQPVRVGFRSRLPEGGEGGSGGSTEPGWKWTLWGQEAARIYLIEPFWTQARLQWDYSTVPGCEEVVLQIAGPDGFAEPNSMDAASDPGVAVWYSGPVTLPEFCLGVTLSLRGDPAVYGIAHSLDLQYTGEEHEFWDNLSVRLVPMDGAGNQVDVASDHVSVGCVDLPLITVESCDVEWTWGESPRRRIEIELRLERAFPANGDTERSTLAFAAWTPHTGTSIARAVLENEQLLNDDGIPTGEAGTWEGKPAYFALLPEWVDGARLVYTLEQRATAAEAPVGMLGGLLHFTDLFLRVHCIPGLTPQTYTCGRMLKDDGVPEIPCAAEYEGRYYDAVLAARDLFAGHSESGLEPIFELFTRPLRGTKHTVRTVDGEETEDREEDVTVEFRYTEDLLDAQDFERYLMRASAANSPCTITLVETIGSRETEYSFRMLGFHATMTKVGERSAWYHGPEGTDPARLIFDPPRLRTTFYRERGRWDEAEGRWIDDVERVEYDVGH